MLNILQCINKKDVFKNIYLRIAIGIFCGVIVCFVSLYLFNRSGLFLPHNLVAVTNTEINNTTPVPPVAPIFDEVAYNAKLLLLANIPAEVSDKPAVSSLWPVKTVYPLPGALLPFNRIVAYYGNFYSTKMGVLGEYQPQEMLQKLQATVAEWNVADPSTPAVPALDYIAVTAQIDSGVDGKYRFRMPVDQIQKAVTLAEQVNGIVILDIQVGGSSVQEEIPLLEPYLKLPQVHLALDPEFSMKNGKRPGTVIGTMDAEDINFTVNYLASLVRKYNLPPKVLIIHHFTKNMVTNYQNITPLPEVQIVMDMDGWGTPEMKINIYKNVISKEPVQFTGIKLFYKNDLVAPAHILLTPAQILKLMPQPSFIQYQ